jgi:RNA polymerase sigma factor (sigma-70 family)
MSDWQKRLAAQEPGFEKQLVEQYTTRLLHFARRQLPDRMQHRLDPEDLVQSVYRSFFQRLSDGRFSFAESGDLWRLLAAMTFQRVTKAIRFHHQQRRDVRREQQLSMSDDEQTRRIRAQDAIARDPGPEDVAELFESLECLLNRLPDKYREIAVLQLQGCSTEEISEKVHRSRRTVFRALAELEELAIELLKAPL